MLDMLAYRWGDWVTVSLSCPSFLALFVLGTCFMFGWHVRLPALLCGSGYFCSLSMTCSMSRRGWLLFELLRYRVASVITSTLFSLGRIAVPAHPLLKFPTSDWPKGWNYDPRTSSPANFGELIYSRCADGSHYPSPRMFAIVDFEWQAHFSTKLRCYFSQNISCWRFQPHTGRVRMAS
jgi:hypothetical protein